MGTEHAVSTNDYLQSTELVLLAGKQLRKMIGTDPSTLEYYVTGLERAAQQHDTGGGSYRDYMLSTLEAAELESNLPQPGALELRVAEDTLASISADFQVANVLMAAGQVLGETGTKAPAALLDDALGGLEVTTQALQPALLSPLDAQPAAVRMTLAGATPAVTPVVSTSLTGAQQCFQMIYDQTLAALVKDAQEAIGSAITALSKIDPQKVLEALSKLGAQVSDLPKIGRLFAQGVQKLEDAIDALIRLLGNKALEKIKAQVKAIWKDVTEGKYTTLALEHVFDTQGAREYLKPILEKPNLEMSRLDNASTQLLVLQGQFKDTMQTLGAITSALTLGGSFLALTTLATPELALGMALAYLVVMGAVLLSGMDYADAGKIIKRVAGVRVIAGNVIA